MIPTSLTLLLILLTSGPPPTPLSGTVVTALEGRALVGATVELAVAGASTRTDGEGRFQLDAALAGDTLVVAHPGYAPARIPLGPRAEEVTGLRVVLDALEVFRPMDEAHAQARERARDVAETSGGWFWPYEEFERYTPPVQHVHDLLAYSGLVAEVARQPDGGRCIRIREGADCATLLYSPDLRAGFGPELILPGEVVAFVVVDPERWVVGNRGGNAGAVILITYEPS